MIPAAFKRLKSGTTSALVNVAEVQAVYEVGAPASTRWAYVALSGGTSIGFQNTTPEELERQLWGDTASEPNPGAPSFADVFNERNAKDDAENVIAAHFGGDAA